MWVEKWKVEQKARLNLLLAQNCAHATLLSLEDVFRRRNPSVLQAATNFEGGVVGCGETCGVVTGGVLGIGALLYTQAFENREVREKAILRLARDYKSWFEGRFGTSVCRERTSVDFWKTRGLVRYLLPGDKLLKCLNHIGQAVWFLSQRIRTEVQRPSLSRGNGGGGVESPLEPHCCFTVLRRLAPARVESDHALAAATTGLAGGVALSGSVCGALLGGILNLGLHWGYDPRSVGVAGIVAAFVRGHRNLVRPSSTNVPREAFARSRALTDHFRQRFGSLRCRDIAGRVFSTSEQLRVFLRESRDCQAVLSWCEEESRSLGKS